MKLEHFGLAGPGDCRVVFSATGPELAQVVEECRTAAPELSKEDLLTEAVNRAILAGFPALYEQLVAQQGLIPLSDPDFGLLEVSEETGFRAGAEFFCLPPLELGRCTGFVQAIRPRPIRKLTLELEINRNYGDADRAADPAAKQELRAQAARKLYAQRCAQAEAVARQELLNQLGAEVKGELPKQLLAQNYFAEQRAFNLRLQANGVNFDQYLQVQGQTVEQFRTWLHQLAEQKLRSRLGLLLVAQQEGLWPAEEEVDAALSAWDPKIQGEKTFAANDRQKLRRRLAADRAAAFVLAHSTLTPPPEQPVLEQDI